MAAAGGGKDDRGEEPGDYRPRRFFEAEPGGKTNIQKVSFRKSEDPGYDLFKPKQEELSVFSEPGREDESDAVSPGVTRLFKKLDEEDIVIKDQTEELYHLIKDIQTNGVDVNGQEISPYDLLVFGLVPLEDSQFSFENAQLFLNHLEDVIDKVDKYIQIMDLREEDESEGEFIQRFLARYTEAYGSKSPPLYSTFKRGGYVQKSHKTHRVGRMK